MHCVMPKQMFIKLLFNEEQGSIAEPSDSRKSHPRASVLISPKD